MAESPSISSKLSSSRLDEDHHWRKISRSFLSFSRGKQNVDPRKFSYNRQRWYLIFHQHRTSKTLLMQQKARGFVLRGLNLGRVQPGSRGSDWKPVSRIQERVVTETLAKLLGSLRFLTAIQIANSEWETEAYLDLLISATSGINDPFSSTVHKP